MGKTKSIGNSKLVSAAIVLTAMIMAGVLLIRPDQSRASWEDNDPPEDCAEAEENLNAATYIYYAADEALGEGISRVKELESSVKELKAEMNKALQKMNSAHMDYDNCISMWYGAAAQQFCGTKYLKYLKLQVEYEQDREAYLE